MRVKRTIDRSDEFEEDVTSPQTLMRHKIDKLIAYLCRASWHKHPEDFDMVRADELLDEIEEVRERLLADKKARRAARWAEKQPV